MKVTIIHKQFYMYSHSLPTISVRLKDCHGWLQATVQGISQPCAIESLQFYQHFHGTSSCLTYHAYKYNMHKHYAALVQTI